MTELKRMMRQHALTSPTYTSLKGKRCKKFVRRSIFEAIKKRLSEENRGKGALS